MYCVYFMLRRKKETHKDLRFVPGPVAYWKRLVVQIRDKLSGDTMLYTLHTMAIEMRR